ncbi:alpha/beta fold hydrolase [Streptomyces sp. NPDC058683]|uniref:alpha/beta fold hydrolase n=1 Tax=Streptomyces sp. NPDC058683 TaxID=3346597 RepID=UPI00365EDDD7
MIAPDTQRFMAERMGARARSGHLFLDLVPQPADRDHLIAPDLPRFGQSDMPNRDSFTCTFEALTDIVEGFTDAVGFDRHALYVFDYGAPPGSGWPSGGRNRSLRSSRRTETPTRTGSATAGTPSARTGRSPHRPTTTRSGRSQAWNDQQ